MSPDRLARELGIDAKRIRAWLRRSCPRSSVERGAAWVLTPEQINTVRAHFSGPHSPAGANQLPPVMQGGRKGSDESYVIDLCDEVLGETARRQHRFEWLRGDPNTLSRCAYLLVDAFYEKRKLVVEYRELQHEQADPFFDRSQTVSGVGRREQRRIYDKRRELEIPKRGLRLLIITPAQLQATKRGRLCRDRAEDLKVLRKMLRGGSEKRES